MTLKPLNPYSKENITGSRVYFPMREDTFDEGVNAAFDMMKPKKFSGVFPTEGQEIILLSLEFRSEIDALNFKSERVDSEHKYYLWLGGTFTHWLPFPKFN